jgi:uncharacterized Zn-finger protein
MMAANTILRLHNQPGVPQMRVGTNKFMCMGALPPFDHPHIFIDMGDDIQVVCPYCSTLFNYDPQLEIVCEPEECVFRPENTDSSTQKSANVDVIQTEAPAEHDRLRSTRR